MGDGLLLVPVRRSVQTLLGDRLPVILVKQVKQQLSIYLRNLAKVDVDSFIQTHKASMIVALQVDGLADESPDSGGYVYFVYRSRRRGCYENWTVTNDCSYGPSAMLMVQDDEDGEQIVSYGNVEP